MIDVILFISNYSALVAYLDDTHPTMLLRDEQGHLPPVPVITDFSRMPAVVKGNRLLAYVRITSEEGDQWRGTPNVEVLAEEPFDGPGTGDALYQQIWDDKAKLKKYDSVYDRSSVELEDEEGNNFTYTPPAKFDTLAGA